MRFKYFIIILFILTGAIKADDTVDPNRPPIIPLSVNSSQTADSDFSFGLILRYTNESDQINNNFGFGGIVYYDRFQPIVFRGGLDFMFSSVKVKELPDGVFISVSPQIDVTLRANLGRFKPFIGGGVNFQINYLSLNEPKAVTLTGYDSTSVAKSIGMGHGFNPHLRAGIIYKATDKFDLFFEFAYMSVDYTVDIDYQHYITNQVIRGTLKYDMPTLYFSIGVMGKLKKNPEIKIKDRR